MNHSTKITDPYECQFTVEPYLDGVRVDSFLRRQLRNYSVSRIQRLVQTGNVCLNGGALGLSQRVFRGQSIFVRLVEPPDKLYEASPVPLEIVFEDPWIIVVNKSAGMVVHPVGMHDSGTLCNALQWHLDNHSACRGLIRPGIVHRLDRMTSGLIIVAKDHLSHRALSIGFQRSQVKKSYLAIVDGQLPDRGEIDLPIGRSASAETILMSAAATAVNPKPAATKYEVVQRADDSCLVLATPVTGRNHQIRVHFAAIGHPLIGDEFYAADGLLKPKRDATSGPPSRHALHATQLQFAHPITGAEMQVQSAVPDDMSRLLR